MDRYVVGEVCPTPNCARFGPTKQWRGAPVMPSHIRAFWWLSVAIVACSIISTAWLLLYPSAQFLAALEKLPPLYRTRIIRSIWTSAIVMQSVRCAVILALAWFAAFRRQNWARWAFAIIFIAVEIVAISIAFYQHRVAAFFVPSAMITLALAAAALAFVFSGNARDWFARASGGA